MALKPDIPKGTVISGQSIYTLRTMRSWHDNGEQLIVEFDLNGIRAIGRISVHEIIKMVNGFQFEVVPKVSYYHLKNVKHLRGKKVNV